MPVGNQRSHRSPSSGEIVALLRGRHDFDFPLVRLAKDGYEYKTTAGSALAPINLFSVCAVTRVRFSQLCACSRSPRDPSHASRDKTELESCSDGVLAIIINHGGGVRIRSGADWDSCTRSCPCPPTS